MDGNMKLRQCLEEAALGDLRTIAAQWGFPNASHALKVDLIHQLSDYLSTPSIISAILAGLSPAERVALDALIAEGGRMATLDFLHQYGPLRRPGVFREGRPWVDEPRTPAEGLFQRGLVYRAFQRVEGREADLVVIPEEILLLLPRVRRKSVPEILEPAGEPAHRWGSRDIVYDLFLFLSAVQREGRRLVRGNRLAVKEARHVAQDMGLAWDEGEGAIRYLTFVMHVAERLGLVVLRGQGVGLGPRATVWLSAPRARQLADIWERLSKDEQWNEAQATIPPGSGVSISSLRRHVATYLAECPPGQWVTVVSFVTALTTAGSQEVRRLLRLIAARGEEGWGTGWAHREAWAVRCVLEETFAWLGLVELGGEGASSGPEVFRLTAAGAQVLGVAQGTIAEPSLEPLIIQANFEILAPRQTDLGVLLTIERMTTLRRRDQMSIYALTRDGIAGELARGTSMDEIIALLERACQHLLPQNVRYTLEEWGKKYGEITIGQPVILITATDALMTELRANRKLGVTVLHELSPRAVVIPAASVSTLVGRLRKAGYLPQTDRSLLNPGEGTEGRQVQVDEEDLVILLAFAMSASTLFRRFLGRKALKATGKDLDAFFARFPRSVREKVARLSVYGHHRGDGGASVHRE